MTFVLRGSAQSTAPGRCQPAVPTLRLALLVAALALAATDAAAQRITVPREEPLLADPGGTRLGHTAAGATLATGATRQGHVAVVLDGWIWGESVRRAQRDGHNLQVAVPNGENLRAAPNGRVVARLVTGAYLDEVERRGGWVRVRRQLWLAAPAAPAAAPPATRTAARPPEQRPAPPSTPDTAGSGDPRRAVARVRTELLRAPDGAAAGTLEEGTAVRIIARAGGWVRVEAQGWVRDTDVRPDDQSVLTGVSAAELRTTPDEFKGRLLRWSIQFIALQVADDIRPDFTPGQRYMLARGPAPEYAFVYIAVPEQRVAEVTRLEPLAQLTVVARVLNGRGAYLSNPILELVEIAR